MTPLPKRRLSKKRQGRRRESFNLKGARLSVCSNCKAVKYGHAVCPKCGFYNGAKVGK